ncbi:MAG: IS21 family transposase [Actinomycetota bacterium]|nr:IS21 family transposase [Actinomycetota bacterium]
MEVDALVKRGWNISAIARHLGRDRGTISNYVNARTTPGVRRPAGPDPLERFSGYVAARFVDDPHLWATALYDEVVAMGYDRSYPSFARQLRQGALRPHCEACTGVKGRETVEIDHPAGEETQWDWFERRHAPWGATAYVLLGTLSHSGRTRGVLAEAMDQPHLIEAMDAVMRRLGGTTRIWRTDRLATVIVPGSRDVQASFAPVAKHYSAIVAPCPPRRGNRKGAVECGVKYVCGRWWRTMTATTPTDAQVSLDRFLSSAGDARLRPPGRYVDPDELTDGQRPSWPTVGALADAEVLMALPAVPYPATVEVTRPVDDRASVAFRGNRYSVAPGLGGVELTLRHRLGTGSLEVFSPAGALMVSHRLAPPGAGSMVRTSEHRAALEAVVLSQFSTARPCDRKANKPPGTTALAERARLMGSEGTEPVVDLAGMAEVIRLAFPGITVVSADGVAGEVSA